MDQIGSLVGYVAFGFASDRFGRRPSFTAFSVIKALGLAMVTLGWNAAGGYTRDDVRVHAAGRLRRRQLGLHRPAAERSVSDLGARGGARHHLQHRARRAVPGAGDHRLVAARFTFGAGIALAVPFALLAGATVWTLPETKGVRLMKDASGTRHEDDACS